MLAAFLTGLAMTVNPSETTQDQRGDAIAIEETGVATSYEATKNITCGSVEWRVKWKAGPSKAGISGNVSVVAASKNKDLPEAQAHIFGKFATIDSVSATCNGAAGGAPARSTLLVSGNDADGKKALAQVHLDSDLKPDWSFNVVG